MEEVYLSRCASYDFQALSEIIGAQLHALGAESLVRPGCKAVIKPNLVLKAGPESGVATHPLVVAAVGCWLKSLGAVVTIAESPGGVYTPASLKSVYTACGYVEMAEKYGLTLNYGCGFTETKAPQGKRSRLFDVIDPILQADLIVDAAKLKSHCMMGLSGASKNMFGSVPGLMKPELHCRFPEKEPFAEMLVDLCELVKPSLCIVDGITAMEGNGPTGGTARFGGVVLASRNPYAVDLVCAELINMRPETIPLLKNAMERGLCPKSLGEILVLGDSVAACKMADFKQPESKSSDFIDRLPERLRPLATKITTPYPKIRERDCVGCGKCAESCPQKTICFVKAKKGRKARIDYSQCIRCYCCHEMCPERTVDIKRFSLFRH